MKEVAKIDPRAAGGFASGVAGDVVAEPHISLVLHASTHMAESTDVLQKIMRENAAMQKKMESTLVASRATHAVCCAGRFFRSGLLRLWLPKHPAAWQSVAAVSACCYGSPRHQGQDCGQEV